MHNFCLTQLYIYFELLVLNGKHTEKEVLFDLDLSDPSITGTTYPLS